MICLNDITEIFTKIIGWLSTLGAGSLIVYGLMIGRLTRLIKKVIGLLILVAIACILFTSIKNGGFYLSDYIHLS